MKAKIASNIAVLALVSLFSPISHAESKMGAKLSFMQLEGSCLSVAILSPEVPELGNTRILGGGYMMLGIAYSSETEKRESSLSYGGMLGLKGEFGSEIYKYTGLISIGIQDIPDSNLSKDKSRLYQINSEYGFRFNDHGSGPEFGVGLRIIPTPIEAKLSFNERLIQPLSVYPYMGISF